MPAEARGAEIVFQAVDTTGDAVFQDGFVEVQEIAEFQPGEAEVGLDLFFMSGQYVLHRFELHENLGLHDKISAKSFFEKMRFVADLDGNLACDFKSEVGEFACKRNLIDEFQKSGAQMAVNRDGGFQDLGSDFVLGHKPPRLRVSAGKSL